MALAAEIMDNRIITEYSLADALGSIIALTDEDGVVKTQYNYTPFGAVEAAGESSDNPFMFTGREYDGDTGLYYYRARYYSPTFGRFISEDPIGLAGGINMYAYTSNSPVNFTDPYGLFNWKSFDYGVRLLLHSNGSQLEILAGMLFLHAAILDLSPTDAVCGAAEGIGAGIKGGYYGCQLKCLGKALGIESGFTLSKVMLKKIAYNVASKVAGVGGLLLLNYEIGLCTLECSDKL